MPGGYTIVLRISIIDKDIPCLISRPVLKRLGCLIDMDDDNMIVKRLGNAQVPLHPVPSGHVAIDFFDSQPQPTPEAFDLCRACREVVVCARDIEEALPVVAFSVQCTHADAFDSDSTERESDETNIGTTQSTMTVTTKQIVKPSRSTPNPMFRIGGDDGSDADDEDDVRILTGDTTSSHARRAVLYGMFAWLEGSSKGRSEHLQQRRAHC